MADIIGLDLGNINVSTSFMDGMEETTGRGGFAMNLADRESRERIPATFFYGKERVYIFIRTLFLQALILLKREKSFIKAVGMIFEPAAAALDYLAKYKCLLYL